VCVDQLGRPSGETRRGAGSGHRFCGPIGRQPPTTRASRRPRIRLAPVQRTRHLRTTDDSRMGIAAIRNRTAGAPQNRTPSAVERRADGDSDAPSGSGQQPPLVPAAERNEDIDADHADDVSELERGSIVIAWSSHDGGVPVRGKCIATAGYCECAMTSRSRPRRRKNTHRPEPARPCRLCGVPS